MEAIQPQEVYGCAQWMVNKNHALDFKSALRYLYRMEDIRPEQFKFMISEYHKAMDWHMEEPTYWRKNMNVEYSVPGPYGEDDHMYMTKMSRFNL
jgi:hypothetical protein